MKRSFFLVLFLLCSKLLMSQTFIEWEQNYGFDDREYLYATIQTNDGGFLLGGTSHYTDGNIQGSDAWLVKTDELGNIEWEQIYEVYEVGTVGSSDLKALLATNDGGFILAAEGFSINGSLDYWLLKTDGLGNIEWEQNYGNVGLDIINSIVATNDGGFLLGGVFYADNSSASDYWIVKVDSLGNMEWEQSYSDDSGNSADYLNTVLVANDGGFLLCGYSGYIDYWVIKINNLGIIEWEQKYGGSELDHLTSAIKTDDGGFLLGGKSASNDGDVGGNNGDFDYWVIKIDEVGNIEWEQNYGGSDMENLHSLISTNDGGFLLGGSVYYSSDDADYWIVKINGSGEIIWDQSYGGSGYDNLNTMLLIDDGNFLLGGYSNSNDGDVGGNNGELDFWVLKVIEGTQAITVKSFYDENENSTLDTNEQLFSNFPFTINPLPIGIGSQMDGTTNFYIDPGTYTIQHNDANNGLWQISNDIESYTVEVTEFFDTILCIPMTPIANFTIQRIDLTSSITRCNQETNYWLTYTNEGTTITDGYVELIPDESTTFVSANPPVDSTADGKLYWFYENLYPTHSNQIHVIFEMPSVDNLGETITFEAQVQTNEGLGDNKAILGSELVCAYDPNDKLVTPFGYGDDNYTLFGDTLEYTVRFQNTGNDTAFTVIIEDQLSEHLDLNTFRPIASSHPVNTRVDIASGLATFIFNDIYLPDSFVNEPASHGFIKYQILGKENLDENTDVPNTASIFFDQNPPIITNTVSNRMVSVLPTLPVLAATPNELIFETIALDESAYISEILTIQNLGQLPLQITDFVFENPAFNSNQIESITVENQSSVEIPIYFEPTTTGIYESELTLKSNDGELAISLKGTAIEATGLESVNTVGFSIFPNPTDGQFYLESKTNEIQSLKIQNSLGQVIYQEKTTGKFLSIDLSKQSKGLYFVSIETEAGVFVEKMIIK